MVPGDHALPLLAESIDPKRHDVAGLEVDWLRLHAHADPGRRAGGDDVARQQGHEPADVADNLDDAEDHRLRVAGLHALAVYVEPHAKRMRIRHLVLGDQPGADRTERVAALALVPGSA